jgi:hypothetical protein
MPVNHKFLTNNFGNGFQTTNALLAVTPYKPEVLIIGTFNPNSIANAGSDFYYSRNYFWPAFKNIFTHNAPVIQQRRDNTNPVDPTLNEIFELCLRLKLSFADLITQTLNFNNPLYHQHGNIVELDGLQYDLIADDDLAALDEINQVNWNTENIVRYICANPTIHSIYFTRRATGIWQEPWLHIINHQCSTGIYKANLYTPAGRRIIAPVMDGLLQRWLANDNPNFGQMNNEWLLSHGVNINILL